MYFLPLSDILPICRVPADGKGFRLNLSNHSGDMLVDSCYWIDG